MGPFFIGRQALDTPAKTPFNAARAQIAQSVEQGIENPRVGGSIPSLGTIFHTSKK